MQVIGMLNGKGGVGKTTLTACLAVRAAAERNAAVCDLDPQSSYSEWYARRGSPDNPMLLRGASHASDAIEALHLTSPYDYVFLDGPPGSILVTDDALRVATLVVIPIRASGLDLSASQDMVIACQDMGTACLAVINGKGIHDGRLVEEARAVLRDWKVPVAETVVAHRIQYVNAMTTGKTGPEKDRKAAEEIDALWAEIKAAARRAARVRAA
jgi:chromosome partitioning protein